MNRLWRETIPRIVLGLAYLPGALNFFSARIFGASFLPMPSLPSGPLPVAGQFLAALGFVPFMFTVKVVTLSSAIMLLTNRAPAFAVALLIPVTAGIVLVHLILIPSMTGWSSLVVVVDAVWTLAAVVCQLILFGTYASSYRNLFQRPAFES